MWVYKREVWPKLFWPYFFSGSQEFTYFFCSLVTQNQSTADLKTKNRRLSSRFTVPWPPNQIIIVEMDRVHCFVAMAFLTPDACLSNSNKLNTKPQGEKYRKFRQCPLETNVKHNRILNSRRAVLDT